MAHERFDNQMFSTIEEFNAYQVGSLDHLKTTRISNGSTFNLSLQRNLVPILLDSFELSRVILKHCDELTKEIEQLLRHLYIQFHPDLLSKVTCSFRCLKWLSRYLFLSFKVDRITMDDITKYCLSLEKRDKPNRAKPKK